MSDLLAQAREASERHASGPEPEEVVIAVCCRRPGDECCNQSVPELQQPEPPPCLYCRDYWPCPDRVFADGVIRALESLATRDTQTREYAKAIEAESLSKRAVWFVTRAQARAILALLDPAKDATNA